MKNYLVIVFLVLIHYGVKASETSLWDLVVKQEQVFLTVEHQGRYLNVWRQNVSDYYRFYVTPLCVMDFESISCIRDEYSEVHPHRHLFQYNIKLWDWRAAEAVKEALKRKNIVVNGDDILPLPMQMVRIGLRRTNLKLKVDNQWRSNQDQPHKMSFEFYVKHKHFCEKLISDAKNDTESFLRRAQLYFEFTMVAGKTESRRFKITGESLQKSSVFSKLLNKNSNNNGIVYLQSKDVNELTHDIFNSVVFEEEMSAEYIPSEQEEQIISELLNVFKQQQIKSNELSKEEWDSVFWNDIFSRPDIQTQHFNEVLKYDENERGFKFDGENDKKFRKDLETKYKQDHSASGGGEISSGGFLNYLGFGFGGNSKISGHGASNTSSNNETKSNLEENEKNIIKFDDLKKVINKEHVNVKWTGEKFEPKNLNLYRLNLKNLNISNQILLRRIVVKKFQTTQKIEIKAESKNVLPSIFERLSFTSVQPCTCPPIQFPTKQTCPPPPLLTTTKCPPPEPMIWKKCKIFHNYYPPTDSCYTFGSGNYTWNFAERVCQAVGGHLASIHSREEQIFVQKFFNGETFWTGATGEGGKWKWLDGSPFDYIPWVGEFDISKCVAHGGKHVYNSPCTDEHGYLCKYPPIIEKK